MPWPVSTLLGTDLLCACDGWGRSQLLGKEPISALWTSKFAPRRLPTPHTQNSPGFIENHALKEAGHLWYKTEMSSECFRGQGRGGPTQKAKPGWVASPPQLLPYPLRERSQAGVACLLLPLPQWFQVSCPMAEQQPHPQLQPCPVGQPNDPMLESSPSTLLYSYSQDFPKQHETGPPKPLRLLEAMTSHPHFVPPYQPPEGFKHDGRLVSLAWADSSL